MYKSSLGPKGVGAFLEEEGGVVWFYLFDDHREESKKIVTALKVCSRGHGLKSKDFHLVWDKTGTRVGLQIRGELWAVFDTKKLKSRYSSYEPDGAPDLPPGAVKGF
ncbi:MAG TPA: hypothetical protein VF950_21595 [Planctomycetota bacterium]